MKDESNHEAKMLAGSGKITIIMAINLGRFMAEKDLVSREIFRNIRGSSQYVQFLKKLTIPHPFIKLEPHVLGGDPWIEEQGYSIGVFKNRLVENWFFPTYELDQTDGLNYLDEHFAKSEIFQKEWFRWDHFKIRLTRNGFIVVKLSQKFAEMSLYDLSIDLLEPEKDVIKTELLKIVNNFPEPQRKAILSTLDHPLPWQLAYQIIGIFINLVKVFKFDTKKEVKLTMPRDSDTMPIMEKHTVIFFKEIYNHKSERNAKLQGAELLDNPDYSRAMLTLWGGTLLGSSKNEEIVFPSFSKKEIEKLKLKNLSAWDDELCLIGPERTLVYCPLSEQSVHLPFRGQKGKQGIRYNDYWKCIIRGIEHIIALRSELQLVEFYTTREMDFISRLTQEFTSKGISRHEKKEMDQLAKRVSNIFNMMPSIRDVLVAPSVFRASYAIEKFDYLIQILSLREIEKHIQKNIEELNFFLSHSNNMVIQQNGAHLQRLAIVFGTGIGFLGLASLLKDSSELHTILKSDSLMHGLSGLFNLIWNMPVLHSLAIGWAAVIVIIFIVFKIYRHFAE
ncbi:MAG: hypothetical protein ACOY90_17060 [Candidatus Zhuqueibacterota bacterium]